MGGGNSLGSVASEGFPRLVHKSKGTIHLTKFHRNGNPKAVETRRRSRICGLMGFTPINLFVGLTKWAEVTFYLLDQPESPPTLFSAGSGAHGAFHAALGPGAVAVSDLGFAHRNLPQVLFCSCKMMAKYV